MRAGELLPVSWGVFAIYMFGTARGVAWTSPQGWKDGRVRRMLTAAASLGAATLAAVLVSFPSPLEWLAAPVTVPTLIVIAAQERERHQWELRQRWADAGYRAFSRRDFPKVRWGWYARHFALAGGLLAAALPWAHSIWLAFVAALTVSTALILALCQAFHTKSVRNDIRLLRAWRRDRRLDRERAVR